MKTFMAKKEEQRPRWYVVDANGQVLGKVAVKVANVLRGKVKPTFTSHKNQKHWLCDMAKTPTIEFLGTGRRKTSVARVKLAPGTGQVIVNGKKVGDYITVPNQRTHAIEPLTVTDATGKYDATCTVE